MNWLLIIAVAVVVLVIVGAIGCFYLTRSISAIVTKFLRGEWERQDIERVIKKSVLVMWLGILFPGSVIIAVIVSTGDQAIRNFVNQRMGGPDLFRHIAIEENDYHNLPLYWKQTLAEIVVRRGDEHKAIMQFVSKLNVDDLQIIGLVSRYAFWDLVVVWDKPTNVYSKVVGELTYRNLEHLEEIGIIKSTRSDDVIFRTLSSDEVATDGVREHMGLAGNHYSVFLSPALTDEAGRVSFIKLTATGTAIIKALRRPENIEYLCQLQNKLLQKKVSARIAPVIQRQDKDREIRPSSTQTFSPSLKNTIKCN